MCPLLVIWIMLSGLNAIAQNTPASELGNNKDSGSSQTVEVFRRAALPDERQTAPPLGPNESSSRKQELRAPSSTQGPCEEPAKLFSASDYTGPLNRFVTLFTRKPELSTVPGQKGRKHVCGLTAREKFTLFRRTTVEPVAFIGAAAAAGYSQWNDDDSEWGQGGEGYGKRFAAAYADRATRNFFRTFFYPTVFRQDPRYFRRGPGGTTRERLFHAIAHTFVARSDSGRPMPNVSLWAGTASTIAVENLYHPGNERGFGEGAKQTGISIGVSMGWDVLREFWPEVVHKLNLPFRERKLVPAGTPTKPD